MEKRDLIGELASGLLNEDEAYAAYEGAMNLGVENIVDMLGFSRLEWTAFMHSAGFADIAGWRRDGWPGTCCECGRHLEVAKFGWLIVHPENRAAFKHVRCPV